MAATEEVRPKMAGIFAAINKGGQMDNLNKVPEDEIHIVQEFGSYFDEIIYETEEPHGYLFLGNVKSLQEIEHLKEMRCTLIISVYHESLTLENGEGINHHQILAMDSQGQNLGDHFEETFNLMDAELTQGNCVLVHCHQGMSRSATITCAYLMKKLGICFDEAIKLQMESRKIAFVPNHDFKQQLRDYEVILGLRTAGEEN